MSEPKSNYNSDRTEWTSLYDMKLSEGSDKQLYDDAIARVSEQYNITNASSIRKQLGAIIMLTADSHRVFNKKRYVNYPSYSGAIRTYPKPWLRCVLANPAAWEQPVTELEYQVAMRI
jgi:hypothetical protein